ncbi:hypothetical protein [Sporosarcina koreensis]|uniref:Transcriptional regulator n=1 Tax=Sporosarcina koreensis TaxID=334735 RepID=A0ABW0TUS0_9BACL
MLVTIGVVGPAESVGKILSVAEEFPNTKCIPFIYETVTELPALIDQGRPIVDQWLFSGLMNHMYAIQHDLVKEEQASFPYLHGSSFFGKLLEIQANEGRIIQSVSIDYITAEEVQKVLSFYDLNYLNLQAIPFSSYGNGIQIARLHEKLYKDQKTEVAITAMKEVYDRLIEAKIPVYRLTPSYIAIKLSIELLIKKAQSKRFENLQMAVIGCQVLNANETIVNSIFEWKHQDLLVKKHLLTLTQKLNGSFVEIADGLYSIYTTKGEIDEDTESSLLSTIETFKLNDQLDIGFTIGYGQTVLEAEQHVRHGLNQLKADEKPYLLIVKTKKDITQKTQSDYSNILNTTELRTFLQERFQLTDSNTRDVLRLAFNCQRYNKQEFTADDVAQWFTNTKRNARRILLELHQAGIIEIYDKTQTTPRGRPSNVYRFSDKEHLFGKEE